MVGTYLRILPKFFNRSRRAMSSATVFTQVFNPKTGQIEWSERGDEYDYHQEVANAGFGDMLHDTERNEKYYQALHKAIARMHSQGHEVHVLDIGTGTGILAMMAVKAGADTVVACEAFTPMADCAERIIAANNLRDKIRLVKKRSTEMEIGRDMYRKANLLVTEILDTELIGEGAIGIYNHAHEYLLTNDAICIPAEATCYAQVAESPLGAQWNTLKSLANLDGDILLMPPKQMKDCKGEAALHDVQLSQLPITEFRPIIEPVKIFHFDFSSPTLIEKKRQTNVLMKSTCPGTADLIFYWWEIKMDIKDKTVLSCAPFWAHPDFKELSSTRSEDIPLPNVVPWRDHWMQAIYYLPKSLNLSEDGTEFWLNCNHDEYSLWFDAYLASTSDAYRTEPLPRHSCTCIFHIAYSRSRIGQLNQAQRTKRYLAHLEGTIKNTSHVLVLSEGCLLGLAIAKMGASAVKIYEPNRLSCRFMESVVSQNKLTGVQFFDKVEPMASSNVTHIFAEPYYLSAILPWDNFYFAVMLGNLKDKLPTTVHISPHAARIMAVPVQFLDLHKIQAPIRNVEGFDLTHFDQMLRESEEIAHSKVEAQPLWEYPCRALSRAHQVLMVNFTENSVPDQIVENELIKIEHSGQLNGIALWVEWILDKSDDPKAVVSTGPIEPIAVGHFIKWDMFVRQGVHLIGESRMVHKDMSSIHYTVDFKTKSAKVSFNFEMDS